MLEVHRTERAGVPVLWTEASGTCVGGIVFRTGAADETARVRGVTLLVTRLAMRRLGAREYAADAVVRPGWTLLYAEGEPAEVAGFLEGVCASLSDLPVDRLGVELRILAIEGFDWAPSFEQNAREWRFGSTGYGMDAVGAIGLEWLGPDDVGAWAAERFVAGNACAFMTAPPPDDLRLSLPPGGRAATPPVLPVGHTYPVETIGGAERTIGLSTLGARGPARDAAHHILVRRGGRRLGDELGISSRVWLDGDVLDGRDDHYVVCADCLDIDAATARAELLDLLHDLAADGPDVGELDWWRRNAPRELDRDAAETVLVIAATDLLFGVPSTTTAAAQHDRLAVTARAVGAAAREAVDTLILLVPECVLGRADDGVHPPTGDSEVVDGVVLTPEPEWTGRLASERLVLGEDGLSALSGEEWATTVRYADCIWAFDMPSGTVALSGIGSAYVALNPWGYVNGHAHAERVKAALAPGVLLPLGPGGLSLRAVALEQVPYDRGEVPRALDVMWGILAPGERAERLAVATAGDRRGMVLLTDRRIAFCTEDDVLLDQPREGVSARGDWRDGLRHLVFDCGPFEFACTDVVPAGQTDRFASDLP